MGNRATLFPLGRSNAFPATLPRRVQDELALFRDRASDPFPGEANGFHVLLNSPAFF
jgi:hypothetical protein